MRKLEATDETEGGRIFIAAYTKSSVNIRRFWWKIRADGEHPNASKKAKKNPGIVTSLQSSSDEQYRKRGVFHIKAELPSVKQD